MTFGQDANGNGIITLNPKELANFKEGTIIQKLSEDAQGRFTITVQLLYTSTSHEQEVRYARLLASEGEAMYKGCVLRQVGTIIYVEYDKRQMMVEFSSVTGALNYIDEQENK